MLSVLSEAASLIQRHIYRGYLAPQSSVADIGGRPTDLYMASLRSTVCKVYFSERHKRKGGPYQRRQSDILL